ncbi:MAG: hypothetical protein NBV63_01370 [Candidatus Pacebacteria bacterium]|nr:hypothetical protein [Candidatus Paceibacterota bacterium]
MTRINAAFWERFNYGIAGTVGLVGVLMAITAVDTIFNFSDIWDEMPRERSAIGSSTTLGTICAALLVWRYVYRAQVWGSLKNIEKSLT